MSKLDATVEKLYKSALNMVHPDKVSADLQAEATQITAKLNAARDAGDNKTVKAIYTDLKYGRILVDFRAKLQEMADDGLSRSEAMAQVKAYKWPLDKVQTIVNELFGDSSRGGADKRETVAYIIELEKLGYKPSEIAQRLADKFGWSISTGKTVVAHLSYMHEYAKQVNHA